MAHRGFRISALLVQLFKERIKDTIEASNQPVNDVLRTSHVLVYFKLT